MIDIDVDVDFKNNDEIVNKIDSDDEIIESKNIKEIIIVSPQKDPSSGRPPLGKGEAIAHRAREEAISRGNGKEEIRLPILTDKASPLCGDTHMMVNTFESYIQRQQSIIEKMEICIQKQNDLVDKYNSKLCNVLLMIEKQNELIEKVNSNISNVSLFIEKYSHIIDNPLLHMPSQKTDHIVLPPPVPPLQPIQTNIQQSVNNYQNMVKKLYRTVIVIRKT